MPSGRARGRTPAPAHQAVRRSPPPSFRAPVADHPLLGCPRRTPDGARAARSDGSKLESLANAVRQGPGAPGSSEFRGRWQPGRSGPRARQSRPCNRRLQEPGPCLAGTSVHPDPSERWSGHHRGATAQCRAGGFPAADSRPRSRMASLLGVPSERAADPVSEGSHRGRHRLTAQPRGPHHAAPPTDHEAGCDRRDLGWTTCDEVLRPERQRRCWRRALVLPVAGAEQGTSDLPNGTTPLEGDSPGAW
jgi:hypothetical protein